MATFHESESNLGLVLQVCSYACFQVGKFTWDVWPLLLTCKVQYCGLYDQGYTSIGSINDTVPNALLSIKDSAVEKQKFIPAYMLSDGRLERASRATKLSSAAACVPAARNGLKCLEPHQGSIYTASIVAVGDEILKLHLIGWLDSQMATVRSEPIYTTP